MEASVRKEKEVKSGFDMYAKTLPASVNPSTEQAWGAPKTKLRL
jgi:hypothetical protein